MDESFFRENYINIKYSCFKTTPRRRFQSPNSFRSESLIESWPVRRRVKKFFISCVRRERKKKEIQIFESKKYFNSKKISDWENYYIKNNIRCSKRADAIFISFYRIERIKLKFAPENYYRVWLPRGT